ncbi:MAG: 6-pyruvoyl-tetrahydropterin synthase-related protein, partial [Dehalococcoidia bacterium]|nr:6-pyruvoyl-tetrahydropterin synthase-related protein [Dehalococcoidia bacterium]
SGLGAFLYARTFFSPLASLLVAIVYMYVPYHIVNVYFRGDIAEFLAYSWFPFILWALTRLVQRKRYAYLVVGSVFYGALILTHNLSAFIFSGFLIIYGLAAIIGNRPTGPFNWRAMLADALRLLAMAAAACALTTFFWLPAIAEKSLIHLDRMLEFDFHENFPTVEALFSTDLIHRYGVVFHGAEVFGYRLGAFQVVFLIIGLVLLVWQSRRLGPGTKLEGLASLAITGVCLFLIFPISVVVWENAPMLKLTQFPWRLLDFIALPSAFLAGLIVQVLSERLRYLTICLMVPTIIVSSVAAMFPILSNVTDAQITPKGSITFELMTGAIGTTAGAEYVPGWVKERTPTTFFALASILGDATMNFSGHSDPGVDAIQVESAGDQFTYRVHTVKAGAFVPNVVYFPGWEAFVDGKRVTTTIDDPSGLIRLEVPEGDHAVRLEFRDTPLRSSANAISLVALLVLVGLLLWCYGRASFYRFRALVRYFVQRRSPSVEQIGEGVQGWRLRLSTPPVSREFVAKVAIVVAVLPLWLLSKSAYDSVYAAAVTYGSPLVANYDDEIMTAGYSLSGPDGNHSTSDLAAGASHALTIFWRKISSDPKNQYRPFIRLTNRFDQTWAYDSASVDRLETGSGRDDILASTFNLTIPSGTPPGTYEIEIGFDSITTKKILEVRRTWVVPDLPSERGIRIGPLVLSQGRPSSSSGSLTLGITDRPNLATPIHFGDALGLLDLSVVDGEARKSGKPGQALTRETESNSWQSRAGETIHVDLLWQARRKMPEDYTITARLMGPDRDFWAIRDSPPADGTYPTPFWAAGQVVRDQLNVTVPAETPPGRYELQLEVISPKGPLSVIGNNGAPVGPTLRLGGISVLPAVTPARLSDVKVSQHNIIPVLDNLDIVGYSLSRREMKPGEQLDVDLVWRAVTAIDRDMVARIEMVTSGGATLASVTKRPVGNAYPTTSWRQGEVLRGKYSLMLPPKVSSNEAKLMTTLLDAKSGEALGHVDLGSVHILPRTRIFSASPGRPLAAVFEDKARLLGFDVTIGALIPAEQTPKAAPSDPFIVTLYWQDIKEMGTAYTVFIQLLNSAGQLVAQNDSPPQAGEAPTTSWVPGEVVIDEHRLSIPANLPDGEYTVIAGLYDAATGIRLSIEGGDYIALTRLLVSAKN